MEQEGAMTATDELRQMLTEAGVEWDYGITGTASTRFNANGVELTFIGMRDGVTCSTILTPAQAIAATVGDGEYENKMDALLCRLTNGKWSMTRRYSLDFMESIVRDEFEEAVAATIGDTDATPTRQDDVDLAADNAKLRELVKRMHRHIRQTCGECDGWYCSNFDEDNECCVYDTLARELGVEVTP